MKKHGEPSKRYGRKTAQGVWQPPDLCAMVDGNGGARYSSIGTYIQHGVAGAYYAKQAGLSEEWLQLIISHTPQSNNRPCRKEGFMFGLIDLADADQIAMAYDKDFPLFYDKL